MKKKLLLVFLCPAILSFITGTVIAQPVTTQSVSARSVSSSSIKSLLKRVSDWQIAHPNTSAEHDDLDWTHAALYMGMLDWAALSEREDNDSSYYDWLLRIGRRNHFQVGKWMYHADFIAVGQPFIDLYIKYGNKKMVAPVMARANWVVDNPSETTLELDYGKLETLDRWAWCDALFMAPPVYAKLYALTGNRKYLDFLNKEYKATYDYLFDAQEQLFYRDRRYFDKKEANGRKVFWGRGNGWVLGGLAEILQVLPKEEPSREFYKQLFVTLSTRVGELQSSDGYWRASLLDPDSYPSPETSATGFIVYALAYGVNEGLLDRKVFLPVIEKGWQALVAAVEPDGKLGYVQPIGADPRKVTRDMTEVYGVGAFLLAGCQIYKLLNATPVN
ncbi:glycoside hydrolase family 88/105 protein [Bacteroides sp. UBA939]|uniref:glycoside hydrolase family 88/105 protein n=1 Tax=Bacteroides sp. UBA939 TaxID=1946092 RepID=UPI0025BC9170|nr:glycoside hydrolase family 88 protein [Bacteroides sp. UBA939]